MTELAKTDNQVAVYSEATILAAAAFKAKLNEPPKQDKILVHPMNKKNYLPISHIETELDECFLDWETINFRWQVVTNEIIGVVDLRVLNPITQKWTTRTGAAAVLIRQTSGSSIDDVSAKIKNALEGDFPHLLADCLRNAAKKLGKRFGRDLNRNFTDTYSASEAIDITDLDAMQAYIEKQKEINALKNEIMHAVNAADSAEDFKENVRPILDKAAKSAMPNDQLTELKNAAMERFKKFAK